MTNSPPIEVKRAETEADIARVYPVMKELRPALDSPEEFLLRVRRQEAQENWMLVYVEDKGAPVAAASFRISEFLGRGKVLYVDDLVSLPSHRGKKFAYRLMCWLEAQAKAQGCDELHLDSGTARLGAHRFYHRFGLAITSFHFAKKLAGG